ncbi:MAG: triose-phosphate isomerase [Patescibacteria group bacterium]|nr:triose-phosphate isomerase [Patescibacteria group bacterium]
MSKKFIAANWKMNTNYQEATALAGKIIKEARYFSSQVVLCPPAIWITDIAKLNKKHHSSLKLGSQNIHLKESGAYTGEISVLMIKNFCQYVIIGHSERRMYFKETDQEVNAKIKLALKNGIKPILCVGEFEQNNSKDQENLFAQLSQGLSGISKEEMGKVIIAYEPVWAIGTGNNATSEYAEKVITNLRNRIAIMFDRCIADKIKILYGGSVNSKNFSGYLRSPQINGLLVGGASLKSNEFIQICK